MKSLAALAARQHALLTYGQMRGANLTPQTIAYGARTGRWERVHRGVYRMAGAPRTFEQDALAASLAVGPHAAVAGRAAARLHGFEVEGSEVEIVVPRGRRSEVRGVRCREAVGLTPADRTTVRNIPVTTPARTLVDLAATLQARELEHLLDELLRRRVVTVSRLLWQLERSHAKGVERLRRLVAARVEGKPVRDTELEQKFSDLLDKAGMPEPVAQFRVRERGRALGRVDFAYPEVRVGIEIDGGQHLTDSQKRADQARQNRIQAHDWLLQRFYRHDVQDTPADTSALLARLLTERALWARRRVPRVRSRAPHTSAPGRDESRQLGG